MNKQQKEQIKKEFIEKHKDTKVIIKTHLWSMTLEEIEDQESYRRK